MLVEETQPGALPDKDCSSCSGKSGAAAEKTGHGPTVRLQAKVAAKLYHYEAYS